MKVGIQSNMSAKALTAGSQNVSAVQMAAVTPKTALNNFLNKKNENEMISHFIIKKK